MKDLEAEIKACIDAGLNSNPDTKFFVFNAQQIEENNKHWQEFRGEVISEAFKPQPTVSHVDAHLYTEIDGYGYCFANGLTCDPTKRV